MKSIEGVLTRRRKAHLTIKVIGPGAAGIIKDIRFVPTGTSDPRSTITTRETAAPGHVAVRPPVPARTLPLPRERGVPPTRRVPDSFNRRVG